MRSTGTPYKEGYNILEARKESRHLQVFPGINLPYSIYNDIPYDESQRNCQFKFKASRGKNSAWSTYPEWVCRYSVNWFRPEVLEWWCEQVAEELEKRAEEIHKLSGGRAKLDYVTFDNVTPSERLMEIEDQRQAYLTQEK